MLGCDHGGVRTGRRLESSREPQISVDLLEVSTRHGWPAVRRVCWFGRSFKRPTSVWPPPSSSAALAGVCVITVEIPQVLLIRELWKAEDLLATLYHTEEPNQPGHPGRW